MAIKINENVYVGSTNKTLKSLCSLVDTINSSLTTLTTNLTNLTTKVNTLTTNLTTLTTNTTPVVLFNGYSDGVITLSSSVVNYSYIEIFYEDNNKQDNQSVRVHTPNGKTLGLFIVEASSDKVTYLRRTRYTILANNITPNIPTAGFHGIYGATENTMGRNFIVITRVLGYK